MILVFLLRKGLSRLLLLPGPSWLVSSLVLFHFGRLLLRVTHLAGWVSIQNGHKSSRHTMQCAFLKSLFTAEYIAHPHWPHFCTSVVLDTHDRVFPYTMDLLVLCSLLLLLSPALALPSLVIVGVLLDAAELCSCGEATTLASCGPSATGIVCRHSHWYPCFHPLLFVQVRQQSCGSTSS